MEKVFLAYVLFLHAPEPIPPPLPEPTLQDLCRFPPRWTVWENSRLAEAHIVFLETDRWMNECVLRGLSESKVTQWYDKAWHFAWCWWFLRCATDPRMHLEERVRCLRNLRERIGKDDYAVGRMPPPAPWWFFMER